MNEQTLSLRGGERAILMRALHMYLATYQRMLSAERMPAPKEDLRRYITAAEALFDKLFPLAAGAPTTSPAERTVLLGLTRKYAVMLLSLCRRERNRRQSAYEKEDFVPAPGHYDANLMRVAVMDDILLQLEEQLEVRQLGDMT